MRTPGAILAICLLAVTATQGIAQPAPLEIAPLGPALPNGRLLAVSHVHNYFAFVVEDSIKRRGPVADVWFYEIIDPPMKIGRQVEIIDPPMKIGRQVASQSLEHERFDCAKRVVQQVGSWAYDDHDRDILPCADGRAGQRIAEVRFVISWERATPD